MEEKRQLPLSVPGFSPRHSNCFLPGPMHKERRLHCLPNYSERSYKMDRGANTCLSQNVVAEKYATVSTVPESHVQLACNSQYCALPLNGNELCIWSLELPHHQQLHLKGHHEPVTAVTFGHRYDPLLICSASCDYVILWKLEECKELQQKGLLPRGLIIGTLLGMASYLRFSSDDKIVAVCAENKIYLLSSEHKAVLAELQGHLGQVTAVEFLSWQTNQLISISEDRTFKVWDHSAESLIHQSSVLSASPLLSIYVDEESKQLVIGSADGQVWFFSLEKDHQYRCIILVDLHKEIQQFFSKLLTPVQRKHHGENLHMSYKQHNTCDIKPENNLDAALPVFVIEPLQTSFNEELPIFPTNARRLWLGSSTSLCLINSANCELEAVLNYEDFSNVSIRVVGSCAIASISFSKVFCLLTSLFGNQISLLEINPTAFMRTQQISIPRAHIDFSVIARCPLLTTSPLYFKIPKKGDTKSTIPKKSGVKSTIKDQPLVFHNKVKSSGYTSAPRMKMFLPKINPKKKNELSLVKNTSGRGIKEDYPVDCLPPSKLHVQIRLADKPTTVCCMQYSGDGGQLACGLADKSLLVFKSNLIGTPAVYSGHDGAVISIGWSHDKNLLVSSADDRTLRIWSARSTEPAVILGKEMFCKPVRCTQFYYMDMFIILSSGAEWQLMKYNIDTDKDDIKRYKQKSMCKSMHTFQMDSTVEITSLSAINDFYSYIVLTAGSNRALEVFDLNAACSAAIISNAHSRSTHQICQNKGSAFSVQNPDAYNLFVTTAIGDGIKLWDLRSLRCVRRFEGHINRCHPCGIAVSPCGRFVASGSEDRCLATATLDGSLQLFQP
ncbi:WD repeat-containing protein 27 isoform X2 [Ambystoma mexicanum]|uniref:WD repeat-containing protein 27 isoform X2 n=1 Tax=Ambystoma mexicanum TaxID=8296 RepID=UPI0037E9619C